jgi:hypothetical protein
MTRTQMKNSFQTALFYAGAIALCVPPLFVFVWMILTGLKTGVQNISYPPESSSSPRWRTSGPCSSSTTSSATS